MNKMDFNTWYIDGSELSIDYLQWHVSINLINDDGVISYKLKVLSKVNNKETSLSFKEIEDAVVFTENIIRFSNDFNEMKNIYYNTLYDQKRYRLWRHDYGSKK